MDEMGSGMLLEMWGALLSVPASKNSEICCHSELNHWLTVTPVPQNRPPCEAARLSPARFRRHSPRWSIPWQARRSSQTPSPGCPPRHRSLQSQRRPPPQGKRPICHCYIDQGGYLWSGRVCVEQGQRGWLLHQGQGRQEGWRGRFFQAGRQA
jgi:hypothetical protein